MLLSKNVGILSLYPTIYFQQTTVITEIVYQTYQNDPYLNYVVLNINGDGLVAGNNNTFLDSSSANLTITRVSDITQGSFSPFNPNNYWSGYFNGASKIIVPSNAALSFGSTGDFTVEAWYYALTNGDRRIVGATTNSSSMFGGNPNIAFGRSNVAWDVVATNINFPLNTWSHVAYIRQGTNGYIYLNGIRIAGPVSITGLNYNLNENLVIGSDVNAVNSLTYYADGYISNLRIVKGLAVYTSNFTPPIDNLTVLSGAGYSTSLLALQNNTFKDDSPINSTLTPDAAMQLRAFNPFKKTINYSPTLHQGSGYFNGTSYLTTPSNAAFAFGTGDFTVECYVYITDASKAYPTILEIGNHSNTDSLAFWIQEGANNLVPKIWSNSAVNAANTPKLSMNSWNHIVWQRTTGNLKIYVNGVGSSTVAFANNLTNSTNISIGYTAGYTGGTLATYGYVGYISNLRIIKGQAIYPSNFTPPASPVTAISNTSLLLNFNNGNVIDSSGSNVITTVGDARTDISNTAPLSSSTGSLYFDGNGDYLVVPNNQQLSFESGPFTIEFWWRPASNSVNYDIMGKFGTEWILQYRSSDIGVGRGFRFAFNTSVTVDFSYTGLPINTWSHIALSKDSLNDYRLFVNSIQVGTTIRNATAITKTATDLWIGRTAGNASVLNGYIDDLRITKGIARYTNNFLLQTYENPTYDISSSTISISSLLVGGGGAGGVKFSGGGGAGGVLLSSVTVPLTGTYNVTIGAGGTAGNSVAATDKATVQNGKNTLFYNLTAYGGGAGADDFTNNAQNGGSGGGANYNGSQAGSSLFGQGFSGGLAPSETNFAGGGGGAGEAGDTDGIGTGGDGLSSYSNILTIVNAGVLAPDGLRYIAGGGSGWVRNSPAAAAGLGGGGTGFVTAGAGVGTSGIVNTGGGGGGSGDGTTAAGGGSGIVILQTSDDVLGNVITTNASKVFNNNRIYYKYTSNGTITTTPNTYTTVYIIGGGGGGAGTLINNGCGGGGGAGGTIISPMYLQGGSYTITIGNGGAGGASGANDGTNGSNTSFGTGVSGLTAFGGGGGGGSTNVTGRSGKAGGCGGGGGYFNGTGGAATVYTSLSVITTNTDSQGFSGANGRSVGTQPFNGGGGGGAGQSGNSFTGGSGIGLNLVGFMEYYAGGGSGGVETGTASGGLGGGGAGGIGAGSAGTAGTAYTGGGGGGGGGAASGTGGAGGSGGSGIVIIKQPINQSRYFTTGSGVLTGIYNNFMIYKFFSSGTLTVPTLEYYVVGGGGGGGAVHGGGGGAGSVIWGSMFDRNLTVGTYSIIIGSGGSGGTGGSTYFDGDNGGNTAFGSITALGGGGGGKGFTSASLYGKSGGSGGGGGAGTLGNTGTGSALSGFGNVSTLSAFVNLGGVGKGGATGSAKAGGGGGAGAGGTNGSTTGNGGAGINIFGLGFFAGGGGGGSDQAGDSTGGSNVGGNGSANAAGTAGAVNTGSGGGGGGGNFSAGGAGGSGAVLISVVTATNPIKSWTGNPVITTSGSNTIYRFNNNGTITI